MQAYLEFEKQVADLEGKIRELQNMGADGEDAAASVNLDDDIQRLKTKSAQALGDLYKKLNPWQKTQVARHPDRPHFKDYASVLIDDYQPLAGDRGFAEDHAIQCGIGRFRGRSVAIMGHEKGNDTQTRLKHNFGMARPEGYRKAVRIMELAQRFGIPVITLVDTAGAYPGIGAEERGQAEAIARSTEACLNLTVPMISVIIGEGGSGGAIAIAAASRVYMLEHSIYSVISPEGAASILWRDATRAQEAATSMKITAQDLQQLGIIDGIIPEPVGGAHRGHEAVISSTADTLDAALKEFDGKSGDEILKQRREKFLAIGRNL
ncbi:MAG: acetyl-CoA carboxylase carboxyltransferase subunit alpha [Rhizobiaceae bacterium]|nr:acetyl-CoA carboxylase carboxyltransferase subunit alpha [Hyphomicrobiales bacterium]NRB31395.1 acetyl-CoA carboxylase carboxyltransferase subunit alpha [Rhizobiaceae bacterium]